MYSPVEDLSIFTPEKICEAHRRLMDTERFQGRYVPAGVMRSATRHSMHINRGPNQWIQCCPFERVEDELFRICDLAQVCSSLWHHSVRQSIDSRGIVEVLRGGRYGSICSSSLATTRIGALFAIRCTCIERCLKTRPHGRRFRTGMGGRRV